MNPFDALLPTPAKTSASAKLRLGTVVAGGVLLTGDTDATPVAASLVALVDDDTVLVATQGRRTYVLGVVV